MPERIVMDGSDALGEAALRAGCRFFCGYPIQPSTETINYLAKRMPAFGGVFMNAESEIEGICYVWGAATAGARAMTISSSTAFSLMQETCAEIANGGTPCVIVNMARGQGDYYQATRGGGHGDYRTIVLAPGSVQECVDLTFLAFDLADKWSHPVLILGDYIMAHTTEAVTFPDPIPLENLPPRPTALGEPGNHPQREFCWTGTGEYAHRYGDYIVAQQDKLQRIKREEPRAETGYLDDAEVVVIGYAYAGRFIKYAVERAREQGLKVGFIRPITLWPYPTEIVAEAAQKARAVAVLEFNSGQMIDDVRSAVFGACPVYPIGGMSQDNSGFGVGTNVNATLTLQRIREVYEQAVPAAAAGGVR